MGEMIERLVQGSLRHNCSTRRAGLPGRASCDAKNAVDTTVLSSRPNSNAQEYTRCSPIRGCFLRPRGRCVGCETRWIAVEARILVCVSAADFDMQFVEVSTHIYQNSRSRRQPSLWAEARNQFLSFIGGRLREGHPMSWTNSEGPEPIFAL
jgi:hypothetical protein